MPVADDTAHKPPRRLLRLAVPLLGSDLIEAILFLIRLTRYTFRFKSQEGMYEVLSYHAQLELLDTGGRKAVLHKRQKVRFLQDNIVAYQDTAWGDGEIFADYKCSPGVSVDRYREGHRYRILISLRGTKNRSDTEEFHIHREIRDGFVNATEDFQIEISHRTRKLSISIVFPLRRQPQEVMLIERNAARSKALGPEHQTQLSDGRQEYTWKTGKARIFEAYIVRWKW